MFLKRKLRCYYCDKNTEQVTPQIPIYYNYQQTLQNRDSQFKMN